MVWTILDNKVQFGTVHYSAGKNALISVTFEPVMGEAWAFKMDGGGAGRKSFCLIMNIVQRRGIALNWNKTKVIRANLLDLDFDLDLDFEDIFRFCEISDLVKFQFW